MKKHIKRLPLYIPLAIVLAFLGVWGASLFKCEIITNKYYEELEYANIENIMIGKINSFKILYCICSKKGNADEILWPCWWYTFTYGCI